MNMGGSNINSEARSFIKRINDDWFSKVSGSLIVKEDNNYAQKCLKTKTDKLIRNVYKELDHFT